MAEIRKYKNGLIEYDACFESDPCIEQIIKNTKKQRNIKYYYVGNPKNPHVQLFASNDYLILVVKKKKGYRILALDRKNATDDAKRTMLRRISMFFGSAVVSNTLV